MNINVFCLFINKQKRFISLFFNSKTRSAKIEHFKELGKLIPQFCVFFSFS